MGKELSEKNNKITRREFNRNLVLVGASFSMFPLLSYCSRKGVIDPIMAETGL